MGLFDLFSDKNERKARDITIAGVNTGMDYATNFFGQGRDALKEGYGKAQTYWAPLSGGANAGFGAYGDATGVNGAEGMARARELFTSGPGYTEGLERGLDSIDRRAAARGMLGSGNTNIDTMKYATDYANTKYGEYVDNLQPYLGTATGIAGAQSGLAAGLGSELNTSLGNQGVTGLMAELMKAQAGAGYEAGKDQTGGNILSALFGGAKAAAGFF